MTNRLMLRSVLALAGLSCSGSIDGGSGQDEGEPARPAGSRPTPGGGAPSTGGGAPSTPGMPTAADRAAPLPDKLYFGSAVRRLTRAELRQTIIDLTGVDAVADVGKFPEDFAEAGDVFAFDNKYGLQQPSPALIEAAKNLADGIGTRVLTDAAAQAKVLPCKPTGPGDAACLRSFVGTFGKRALRRTLAADEIAGYVTRLAPIATEASDFLRAVAVGVRVLLQDLEFLYRVEIGTPVAGTPGLVKLTGLEMASRLSYFLWGTTPDDALLTAAETGDRLGTPDAVRVAATRMLADTRARQAIARFHAMWLGYERQPPPAALSKPMLDETGALIERVILKDRASWLDLFKARETFVDRTLATHYGLAAPAAPAWVPYGATGRQGILSHGTFLGVERKHEDTSPTMRGHFVRTRLLCQQVPDPPADVDIDNAPTTGACKADRYSMWKQTGCKGCHVLMDPIGHGLEGFDRLGKSRTLALGDPRTGCDLRGEGELSAVEGGGAFKGIAGLSDRLVASGALESCLTTQMAHFYLGREIRDPERKMLEAMSTRFRAVGHRFDQLLMDFVVLPGFGFRVQE